MRFKPKFFVWGLNNFCFWIKFLFLNLLKFIIYPLFKIYSEVFKKKINLKFLNIFNYGKVLLSDYKLINNHNFEKYFKNILFLIKKNYFLNFKQIFIWNRIVFLFEQVIKIMIVMIVLLTLFPLVDMEVQFILSLI